MAEPIGGCAQLANGAKVRGYERRARVAVAVERGVRSTKSPQTRHKLRAHLRGFGVMRSRSDRGAMSDRQ